MPTRWIFALLVSSVTAACASQPDAELLNDDEGRYEERRRRMHILVQSPDGQGGWQPATEMSPQVFSQKLKAHCFREIATNAYFSNCIQGGPTCVDQVCAAHAELCMAHLYLELSRTVVPVEIRPDPKDVLRIPPQRTETNAGFGEQAIVAATSAVTISGENLRHASDETYNGGVCTAQTLSGAIKDEQGRIAETPTEALASAVVEGTLLARRAASQARQDNMAVADGDLASDPDRGQAARDAWLAPTLSRLHAAQLYVGGKGYARDQTLSPHYQPVAETGVCSAKCDTQNCRRARTIINESGMAAADIVNMAVPAADLINGVGLSVPGGMADRLSELLNEPALADESAPQVLSRFGITERDLQQAREHMRQEGALFARDTSITVPQPVLATSDPTTRRDSQYTHYAFTTQPATPPQPMHHFAMARRNIETVDDRPAGVSTDSAESAIAAPSYAERSLASLVDYAQSVAFWVTSKNTLGETTNDILGTVLLERVMTNPVRVETCIRYYNGVDELRVRVHGNADPTEVRVVSGASGLACATTGRVEGQACDINDWTVAPMSPAATVTHTNTGVGFSRGVEMKFFLPYPDPVQYYVVRQRTGAANDAAGSWEAIGSTSAHYMGYGSSWQFCNNSFYEPSLYQEASLAMQMDPKQCDAPANDCFGAPLGPLPLEDELIDDGNPYESSFQHHLAVARQAAATADHLGQRLIETGLSMDVNAEGAIRTLEEMCGVTLNLDGLFGPGGVMGARNLGALTKPPSMGTCPNGYQSVGATCILDVLAQAALTTEDARALADCLGADTLVPVVGVGSRELCLWYDGMAPNILCEGATAENPCPLIKRAGATCAEQMDLPPDTQPLTLTENQLLGVLANQSASGALPGSPSAVAPLDCNTLRSLIANPSRGDLLQHVVNTNFYAIENVERWANRIGWRGAPLDFSYFTLDGAYWYGTGQPFPRDGGNGPDLAHWPCTTAYRETAVVPPPDCSHTPNALFCSTTACTDPSTRAQFNRRMGRAAALLALTSGVGLNNLLLPVRYNLLDEYPGLYTGRDVVHDYQGNTWRIATRIAWENFRPAGFDSDYYTGLLSIPLTRPDELVWRDANGVGYKSFDYSPVAFANFGEDIEHAATARTIVPGFWRGLSQGTGVTLASQGFHPQHGELLENSAGGMYRLALTRSGNPLMWIGRAQATRNNWIGSFWREHYYDVRYVESVFVQLFDRNVLHLVAGDGFRRQDAVDALELMCEAARFGESGAHCDPARPPLLRTVADIPAFRGYLYCLANKIERIGETMILQNVPRRVVDAIRGEPLSIEPARGAHGQAVLQLSTSLSQISSTSVTIAEQVRGFADSLSRLETALKSTAAEREIASLQTTSAVIGQLTACASNFSASAAVTCAGGAAQVAIQFRLSDINRELFSATEEAAFTEFQSEFSGRQASLTQLAGQLQEAGNDAESALATLASSRTAAARALAGALYSVSDEAGRHFAVNTAMRREYDTLRTRYLEAHRAAVQASVLARRALEQRIGSRLTDLPTDLGRPLSLVEDPRDWVGRVCDSTGIDYARIRDATDLEYDNYADEYIGDYVARLDRALESYRIDFPAQSAQDVSVISLRDDLQSVALDCPWPTYNLLASSADLLQGMEPPPEGLGTDGLASGVAAWGDAGCVENSVGSVESCVSIAPAVDTTLEIDATGTRSVPTWRVSFGGPASESFTDEADWGQSLLIPAGVYRLSWWGRHVSDSVGHDPATAVKLQVLDDDGLPQIMPDFGVLLSESRMNGWQRYFQFYEVPEAGVGRVRIVPHGGTDVVAHSVDIAAPMLEWVQDRVAVEPSSITQMIVDADPEARGIYHPRTFVATTSFGTALQPMCPDESGQKFRERFTYRCMSVCPNGFAGCAFNPAEGNEHCFWEMSMSLDAARISNRQDLDGAGFAHGNFNYRVHNVAVNFVGTNVRDCSTAPTPGCYASGHVQYTIEHRPPYEVTNYAGRTFTSELVPGVIEHARGLAAERYLTNPLSSADRTLLTDYWQRQLWGRPLSGNLVLRIWDGPGVNFSAIEDVQFVLEYRYFTRARLTGSP